jgi:hypothetical protein
MNAHIETSQRQIKTVKIKFSMKFTVFWDLANIPEEPVAPSALGFLGSEGFKSVDITQSNLPTEHHCVRLGVLRAVTMKTAVFWDVVACRLQPSAHAGSLLADFSNLTMEATPSSEMAVHTRSTWHHIPEDHILHNSM